MNRYITILLLFFALADATGQEQLSFSTLKAAQGLSSEATSCVMTDSRGFTWVGTGDGLNQFDGETFRIFRHNDNDTTSIVGGNIRRVAEDREGHIWVLTNAGLCRLNPWSGKAQTFQPRPEKIEVNWNGDIYALLVDRNDDVWIGGARGIAKLDKKTQLFHRMAVTASNDSDIVSCLFEDRAGRLWAGTYDGLSQIDRSTGTGKNYYPNPDDRRSNLVTSVCEDAAGRIWCGVWGGGLCLFDQNTKQFSTYRWDLHNENPSATNIVFSIAQVAQQPDVLWAGTSRGLLRADLTHLPLDDQHVHFYENNPADPSSIPGNNAGGLFAEKNGTLWIATSDGLSALLPDNQHFRSFSNELHGETMRMIPEGNTFWVTTWYGDGLQQFDASGKRIKSYPRIPANGGVDCGQISDMTRGHDGALWVATFGGLNRVEENTGRVTTFTATGKPGALPSSRITCVLKDHNNRIWCGTYHNGICLYDSASNSFTNFRNDTAHNTGPSDDMVWGMYNDHEGHIWICCNSGITQLNPDTKQFTRYKEVSIGGKKISIGICTIMTEDDAGNIWIATDNGLFKKDRQDVFKRYTTDDGLSNNSINSLRLDQQDKLWLATSNGLTRLDPVTGKCVRFGLGNGLPTLTLSGDMTNDVNGDMLLGLSSRIIRFHPADFDHPSETPAIYFTGLSVSAKPVLSDKPFFTAEQIQLEYDQNAVSFDFVSPGFRGGKPVHYAYRLAGAEKDWTYSGGRHYASYAGLSPGEYDFEAMAAVGDGAWSTPVRFHIVIRPPFWRTWWFVTLCVLTVLSVTVWVVRREATRKLRMQLLRLEKEQAIEKERNRISKDMHDDLGSGLTKIAILSEVAKRKINDPEAAKPQIENISDSARELVDNLNQIIWVLNPENDSLPNLAAYIREYADRFLEPLGIALRCEFPEQIEKHILSEEARRNVFLVVKEALHNAAKYSGSDRILLQLEISADRFRFTVRDFGKGFSAGNVRQFGNGLKNMRKRAEALGGTAQFHAAPGEGTTIVLDLPLPGKSA